MKTLIDYEKAIRRYRERGIRLWVDNGKLRFSSPKGALTEEQLEFLKEHKEKIIEELSRNNDKFLLTDIQSAYLLGRLESFDYGGVACQIYLEMEYDTLEPERTKRAWNELTAKHEMLRAVIGEDGYQYIQQKAPEFEIDYFDLRKENGGGADVISELRAEMSSRTFKVGAWPYFAIAVTQAEDKAIMHISFDFMIADWNSIWLLLKEFEDIYEGKTGQDKPELTFREYLRMENELLSDKKGIADREYWMQRLEQFPERPMLPVYEKEKIQNSFERMFCELDKEKWEAFRKNAEKYGCTPTAAVMTVYAACLAAWSRSRRFGLNLTLLNRLPLHKDVNSLIGDFTSVNLLEVDMRESHTFAEAALQIQRRMMMDLDHRCFSGVKVMRELAKLRGKGEALYPYVFTGSIGLVQAGGMKGKIGEYGISSTPQVFIDCQAMDNAWGLRVNWDVRQGVFCPGVAEAMFASFKQKLLLLSENVAAWEQSFGIAVPKEQLAVRERVNDTAYPLEKEALHKMVWEQLRCRKDKIAVWDEAEQVSYEQLRRRAEWMALQLKEKGCRPGECVAVFLDKQVNQVAAVLAVLAAGGVYVPIDSAQPIQRISVILQEAEIKLGIAEEEMVDIKAQCQCLCFPKDFPQLQAEEMDFEPYPSNQEDLAYIIFTSGSTGKPKGVQISHGAACNTIKDVNRRFHITEQDTVLSLSKLNFDLSVYDIFGLLSVGGGIVFPSKEHYLDPSAWHEMIVTRQITLWNTVPSFMVMLAEYAKGKKQELPFRTVLLSGDWIPVTLPEDIWSFAGEAAVVSLGGATESSIWSNYYICEKGERFRKSIPYGFPLANQGFCIVDKEGMPVPDYVSGELCITGEGLAMGYLNDAGKTAQQFVTNPLNGRRMYRTGDYGYYRQDGCIIFQGRKDAQVKLKGHRIELGEIESVLKKAPLVEEACAVIAEKKNGQKEILAVVTPLPAEGLGEAIKAGENPVAERPVREKQREAEKLRDAAAVKAMLYGLQHIGAFLPRQECDIAEIQINAQIKEEYRWLMKYWVYNLERAGALEKTPKGYRAWETVTARELEEAANHMVEAYEALEMQVMAEYLRQAFLQITEVLTGKVNPVSLLYPQGSDAVLRSIYIENAMAKELNTHIAEEITALAKHRQDSLRILEIGAGSAATSMRILQALKESSRTAVYYFTDVAESFLLSARQSLKEYEGVVCQRFDMNEDYRAQGLLPSSFDVIVASGVLENAKDIKKTLDYIRELLRAGGWLFCTEPTREESWILAAQGFMMTPPEDELRREKAYLSGEEWRELLLKTDGGELRSYPHEKTAEKQGMIVWMKQMKVDCCLLDIDDLRRRASEYLPEYMIPAQIQIVERLPLTANGKIDRKRMAQWFVEEAEKQQICEREDTQEDEFFKKVYAVIAGSLGIGQLNPDKSLYEYGADSLVQAQIAGKLKSLADELYGKDVLGFDRVLRQLLNGTSTRKLAEFLKENGVGSGDAPETVTKTKSAVKEESGTRLGELYRLNEKEEGVMNVLLPPGMGTMSGIQELADAVCEQAKGPVVGLAISDAKAYCNLETKTLMSKLADSYTQMLLDTGKKEFRLVGYCMGGMMALETARRLQERGCGVKGLFMVDSTPVLYHIEDELVLEIIFLTNFEITPQQIFPNITDEEIMQAIQYIFKESRRKMPQRGYLLLGDKPEFARVYALFKTLEEMTRQERFCKYLSALEEITGEKAEVRMLEDNFVVYQKSFRAAKTEQEPYFGDISFLRAKEKTAYIFTDREEMIDFWKEICIGEVKVIDVEGNHFSCIEGENAHTVAGLILE